MNVKMALFRRRFAVGATAALMGASLILGACNDEPEPVVTTPAAETPTVEAATPEVSDTGATTETEGTEAGAEMTGTEEVTGTEEMTGAEEMTGTEETTETEEAGAGAEVTGTEEMTGTEDMTDAAGSAVTETEGLTGTEEMTGTEGAGAAGAATGAAAGAATAAGVAGAGDGQVYATTLLDYDFENADGQVSGEIEDIFLDMSSGRVLFVSIEYGGVLELGDKDIVMPLSAFKIGQEGELVLNFDEAALENYPDMGGDWPDLTAANWDDDVNAFWSGLGIASAPDYTEATTNVVKASELIGYAVTDLGDGAGSVEDIIINLGTATATYALVNFGAVGTNDNVYAVPFSAFNLAERGDVLTFNADITADTFANAPHFDRSVYVPGEPLNPTWHDEFDTFWGDLGFDVGNNNNP